MIIAGAGGHAREIIEIFSQCGFVGDIILYDNFYSNLEKKIFNKFNIINHRSDVKKIFESCNEYVVGVGGAYERKQFNEHMMSLGGCLKNIVSPFAKIGTYDVKIKAGVNIMTDVVVYNSVSIGDCCLLNTGCGLHHDVVIGNYCEISPGARILGGAVIGNYCRIGANACVLPKVSVGDNVIVGAGSIVTKDIISDVVVTGVPGKIIKKLNGI